MARYPDLEAFRTHLETLGIEETVLETVAEPTISIGGVTEKRGEVQSMALHTLPELVVRDSAPNLPADLSVMDTLGEGGMGVVKLARQEALDREVAVKTTRSDVGEEAAHALLREAYVTGFLEHPNIIPIYMVGRTADGAPLIVMKRVEGTSWLDRLASTETWPPEDLTAHIEILSQVARAVWFAHDKGVIHRDVKPDNVMLGEFGEVYLVDWGIAVSLEDDRPLLPKLQDSPGVSGTPGYMAPEMAAQELEKIDERTDVYLLGATLHHILTGQPRHNAGQMLQLLFAAHQSEPYEYGEDVPEELAAIANRACHRNREHRFQSARQFQKALQDFLEHRQSVALSSAASKKLDLLDELVADAELDSGAIHDTYGECRFGFYEALRMWPENDDARTGLQRCLEKMTDYHITQENLEAARACLADLPRPNAELEDRVDQLAAALEERREELARLQRLEKNLDLSTASASRSLVMLILGIVWTASSLYAAIRLDMGWVTPAEDLRHHMISGIRNALIGSVAIFLFRKRLFANAVNRRLVYLFMAMLISVAFMRWSVWYLEDSILLARTADMVIYVVALIAIGLMTDLRIIFISTAFGCAAVISVFWPDLQLYANTVAAAATFGAFAWIWRPGQKR